MVATPVANPVRLDDSHAEALSRSQIYLDYERAFTRGTGLPLALHAPAMIRLARYAKQQENPFCALMARTRTACAACYALQLKLEQETKLESTTLRCFAGMCESVAPVRVGGRVIAFLHTGQVFLQPATRRQFSRVAATLLKWGADVDLKRAEEAYFHTRVIPPARYKSLLKLVAIFAGHLANCADTLLLRAKVAEPPAVAKARLFIKAHQAEELSLARVAQAVNVSASYFSSRFKATTGMTFVDYVTRVRVEKAKALLQNSYLRISEIAFEVGFQSISQFDRAFKRVTGQSPRNFRAK
jgi:AraC-like DNA-binding protein